MFVVHFLCCNIFGIKDSCHNLVQKLAAINGKYICRLFLILYYIIYMYIYYTYIHTYIHIHMFQSVSQSQSVSKIVRRA